MTKTVYIVGSKGIPAKYGGFETFVEKLTEFQQDKEIHCHLATKGDNRNPQTNSSRRVHEGSRTPAEVTNGTKQIHRSLTQGISFRTFPL